LRGTIRSVEEAGAWLEGLINVEKRPDWPYARMGLAPIRTLLERLGDPHQGLACLHVAGSKGKGSTCLLAEGLLRACGEKVGTFTSPHLERWTERVRIGGREVEGAELAAAVEAVRPHVEALRASDPAKAPTFFDATTAAALVCFREAGVDRAVLEVGLGGRLDSTNVVTPQVACVTSIELEHTDRLGDTLAAIAGEKAGILKPGVPAVAGALPPEAMEVVEARARELGAPLAKAGIDFEAHALPGGRVRLRDGEVEVETSLRSPGPHQAANAALALACVRRAGGVADALLADRAGPALAATALPGRAELLRRDPVFLVDSAHTAASARALAAVLEELGRPRTRLVLSVSAGKDTDAILGVLLPFAESVTATRAEPARSLAPPDVAEAVRRISPDVPVRIVPNPHLALRAAAEGLPADACLCVAGSVYLAGIARRVLAEADPAARVAVTRRAPDAPAAGG
jgi:dihydrofolate synthase/folylpolyglutamate synthase